MVNLFSQIKFIYEFSTQSQKTSDLGYCVTCIEIALEGLLSEEETREADGGVIVRRLSNRMNNDKSNT